MISHQARRNFHELARHELRIEQSAETSRSIAAKDTPTAKTTVAENFRRPTSARPQAVFAGLTSTAIFLSATAGE
jgi:hypothetical protein